MDTLNERIERLRLIHRGTLVQSDHYAWLAGESAAVINELQARLEAAREGLAFVVEREDFSFAECSVAEAIWERAKKAMEATDLSRAFPAD